MTCNEDMYGNLVRHKPQCEHSTPCVSCGTWWLNRKKFYPFDNAKVCTYCLWFEQQWEGITKNLDIDWENVLLEESGNV